MFQKGKHDIGLLKRLKMTLQAVLCDAENKQTSNPYVNQWLNELQDTVDSAENLIEEINYDVLRVKSGRPASKSCRNKQQAGYW
uniref:Disease resistance RPP13-like protein 1 n=1 Tax=Nicotiana tabacum TaxID=4097 RepID=A0A1S4AK18_TOBAC|nr:PREDICTED: putative disease resistance RPP13-like protein 1 [Nicotiana tabacum]